MLPTGRAGKDYIDEITRLLNAWRQNSAMKHIVFKVILVMRSLILQSHNPKAKDHSEARLLYKLFCLQPFFPKDSVSLQFA